MEEKINAVLEGLNEEQKSAVNCTEGPVLIVAGAGSGKTRVLTSRIALLLAKDVDPGRILALTFTKKAAGEMKERIASMVGDRRARRLVMGTFHAVFVRFLREYAESLGYPQRFVIYDTSDSQSAMKACIKELQLDDKIYKPKEVLSRISMAKNNLVTVNGYRNNRELQIADSHSRKPRICDLYELYQKKLKESGVMDFDDILLNMNYLLRDNKEALQKLADLFLYIMVDEYQDTNYAQYLILKKLSQIHRNICVVGDDSQSIYAFRGAKIENILNFRKDYPDCHIFRLERNYRSTSTIVDAANTLIAHNEGRIPKECYAVGAEGEKIRILKAYTEQDEAINIVSEIIARVRSDHAQYRDFAILYRTNSQSRAIEEQLRRRNIPYMIYSGNSFFDRAEVKDMMAYFKLCINPDDNESFRRVVNKPARGIGDVTMTAVETIAREKGVSFFRAGADVPKVKPFCDLIARLSAAVSETGAHDMALRIADESGLYASYKMDTSIEGLARIANLDELLNSTAVFEEEQQQEVMDAEELQEPGAVMPVFTLDDYVENVSLLSNVDVSSDENDDNKVALMTVHSAKGLEFPYVFIAGLEENLFPSLSMLSSANDVEEERRLFYVAMTRAEKTVTLSFAGTRMRNGKHESNAPSRFIHEIDPEYIENPLADSEFDNSGVVHEWGGFGSRFSGGRLNGYGSGRSDGSDSGYGRGYGSGRGSDSGYGSGRQSGYSRYGASSGPSGPSGPGNYGRSSSVTYERNPRNGSRPGAGFAAGSAGHAGSAGSRGSVGSNGNVGSNGSGTGFSPASARPAVPPVIDPDFKAVPMTELRVGERVEHIRFGAGQILEITGNYPDMKARIRFDDYGEKLLLLKYAKLRHCE